MVDGLADGSYWWRHEKLHRSLLNDFRNRSNQISEERDKLEDLYINKMTGCAPAESGYITTDAFQTAARMDQAWLERFTGAPPSSGKPAAYYRRYWDKQNRAAVGSGLE